MDTFKAILVIAGGALILVVLLGLLYLTIRSWQKEQLPQQKQFVNGTLPAELPDGSFNGASPDLDTGSWKGKVFDRSTKSGRNRISGTEKYPFEMYVSKVGLRDKVPVVTINYNIAGNPWWLRLVTDEIVEVAPNKFLGKVHVRILGLVFTVGYFELST